jgi:polyisoprenoid-binding protein YceI
LSAIFWRILEMKRLGIVFASLVFVGAVAAHGQQPPPAGQQPPPAGQQQPPTGQPPANPAAQPQRPPQPPLAPNEWRIDRSHSQANFSVKHNVVSTVRGQLGPIAGKVEYDGKDVRSIVVDVTIDVTAINTGNQGRDNDLRGENFFSTTQFPTMSFKSKRVEAVSQGKFKIVGDLTIRDKTKEVVLDVEGPSPVIKGPRGVLTGASATTTINRKDFGIMYNRMIEALPVVSDEVAVIIDMELGRPAMPGSTGANQ